MAKTATRLPGRGRRRDAVEGEDPEHGQQGDQRVHPGLGVVADGEWRRGQQQQRSPCHRAAPQASTGQPGQRQCHHPDHSGEGADGEVRWAKGPHPEVQQHVEEGRRPVHAEVGGDVVERLTGDVDGQGFVEPEVGAGPEPQHQPGDEDQRDHHRQGGGDGRRERRPLGVLEFDAGVSAGAVVPVIPGRTHSPGRARAHRRSSGAGGLSGPTAARLVQDGCGPGPGAAISTEAWRGRRRAGRRHDLDVGVGSDHRGRPRGGCIHGGHGTQRAPDREISGRSVDLVPTWQ